MESFSNQIWCFWKSSFRFDINDIWSRIIYKLTLCVSRIKVCMALKLWLLWTTVLLWCFSLLFWSLTAQPGYLEIHLLCSMEVNDDHFFNLFILLENTLISYARSFFSPQTLWLFMAFLSITNICLRIFPINLSYLNSIAVFVDLRGNAPLGKKWIYLYLCARYGH